MVEDQSIVVAIDGPAGAGKSTAARRLAERLGFEFLDTGAMYRCVTLAALESDVDLDDPASVTAILTDLSIELEGAKVRLNGRDVSEAIRDPRVSSAIGAIADNPAVRAKLSDLQRTWASGRKVVSEGRDQGTDVFPDSPCKIFLTASAEERARRRCDELARRNIQASFDDVLQAQQTRDAEDRRRPIGSLRQAPDAELVLTDGLTLDQVVDRLVDIVRAKIGDRFFFKRTEGPSSHGDHPHVATRSGVVLRDE